MGLFKKKKLGRTLGTGGRYRQSFVKRKRQAVNKKFQPTSEKKLLRPKAAIRKNKKIIRPLIILGVGIVIYIFAHIFLISDIFTVTKIEYSASSIEVEDENPVLNYVKTFKGSNIFLVKTESEEEYLRNAYPEYKTINIKKSVPHTLIVEIEIFEEAANIIKKTETVTQKFVISANGVAMQEDAEDPSLPYIYIETPETIMLGKEAVSAEALDFILEAMQDFENKFGLQVLDASYYKTSREVHIRTERYFDVWLDTQQTVDEQLNKLKQALPELNIYEDSIQYIDLRISGQSGDKVIYMPL